MSRAQLPLLSTLLALIATFITAPAAFAAPGEITTVAGTGAFGFSGDGGPATSAVLDSPVAVAVDGDGNFYLSDHYNHMVRKVDASGTITRVAGNGISGFSGNGGPAIFARLGKPRGLAVDGDGNLYITDWNNNRVRKVDASGTISTVAGRSVAGFSGDGGPATSAQLNRPRGLAVDGGGNLYIADSENNRVRKVDASGTIATIAGKGRPGFSGDGGRARSAKLNNPRAVAVDGSGGVYIADQWNARVRKVNGSGTITTIAGRGKGRFSGDGGPATLAGLNPHGVAIDGSGNLLIADNRNSRVREVEADAVAPNTTINSGPSGVTNDATPTFKFSSSDPGSVFQCKIDGSAYFVCASPKSIGRLADGAHTLLVRAIDPAGNVDPIPAARSFNVQTAAVAVSGKTLTVTAAAGAKDKLVISRSSAKLRVVDSPGGPYTGSGFRPGAGCTRGGDYAARCNAAGISRIKVFAGDQGDRVVNSTAIGSSLDGGAGNDIVIGGSSRDAVTGGPGVDVLRGLSGQDLLSARDLTSDARIDCGAGRSEKADIDLLPLDPNSVVKGCETRRRH